MKAFGISALVFSVLGLLIPILGLFVSALSGFLAYFSAVKTNTLEGSALIINIVNIIFSISIFNYLNAGEKLSK